VAGDRDPLAWQATRRRDLGVIALRGAGGRLILALGLFSRGGLSLRGWGVSSISARVATRRTAVVAEEHDIRAAYSLDLGFPVLRYFGPS